MWILKESIKHKLLVLEKTVLKRIFGPTEMNNGIWRIKYNSELNRLIKIRNINIL